MSVSWLRILGLMVVASWLAAGCSSEKKIDVGGTCIMNSDCTQPLVCTMGKCHDACHTSADCPAGQSCVKIGSTTICQLPAEADCSTTLSCGGGLVCASDLRCRTACQLRTDCTIEQMCVGGVCAAPSELDEKGQLPQRGPGAVADGGTDVRASDAGGQAADLAVGRADVPGPASADAADMGNRPDAPADVLAPKLPDASADLPTGTPDATVTSSQTVALFHFDGTEGSTNLADSSGTGKVATIHGNPVLSTAQSKFGGASLYINGNSSPRTNYVAIDGSGSADLALDGDFTVDWWQYLISITNTYGASIVVSPTAVPKCSSGGECLIWGWGSSNATCCDRGCFTCRGEVLGGWQHIALVRKGSTLRYFMDGTQVGEASRPGTLGGTAVWLSGTSAGAGDNGDFNGYIDELRVVKGVAVWTGNFTPPTAPYTATDAVSADGGIAEIPVVAPDAGKKDVAADLPAEAPDSRGAVASEGGLVDAGSGGAVDAASSSCAGGPDGWCWGIFSHFLTTAAWATPPSASSVHASLTSATVSDNAGVGFVFSADRPFIDLSRFDRIVFTATASTEFGFNVASSATAGCTLEFAGSGTEQTYTFKFSDCSRWTTDLTQPGYSLASVSQIHWDTAWGIASSLDIEIVPDILFCLGTQCTANPLSP